VQAMGTPITVTTPNPGEVIAIQPASGTPAAPFDAVLALMVPEAGAAGTPVAGLSSAAAPVVLPTAGTNASPSPTADTTLPTLAIPPVQPVVMAMVNAADPAAAEADIAALMAATALATRGVVARPPEPVSLPVLAASPEATVPEDFIGPVRPPELTADPAALAAGNAPGLPRTAESHAGIIPVAVVVPSDFIGPQLPVELPEAAEFPAAIVAAGLVAPADFVGPQLPPEVRMAGMKSQQHNLMANDLRIKDIVSQPDPLLEMQALIQPMREVVGTEQTEEAMAPPPILTAENDHAPVHVDSFFLAATVSASATITDGDPTISAMDPILRTTAATAYQKDETSERTLDPARYGFPAAIVDAPLYAANTDGHDSQRESRSDDGSAAIAADASNNRPLAALMQQAAMLMPQAVSQDPASGHIDATKIVSLPQTSQPVAINLRTGPQPLTHEEGLLRVMNEIAPAKPQSPAKTDRTLQLKSEALSDLAAIIAPDDVTDLTPRVLRDPMQIETDASGALLQALARASANRDEARHLADARSTEHVLDINAERTTIDPKAAAMVRSVTVTHGVAEAASDTMTATTIVAPSPVVAPSADSIARDANNVAAVSADGRRDTKRDAEIRQRQIEQQINIALRSGTPEIRMQLYPPGLGQVIIRLALDGQKLRLAMMSDNEDATASLAQTELGLRDALSRDGYTLAGFDVHDNGENNRRHQSRADAATQPTASPAEGDAFSVDMTA